MNGLYAICALPAEADTLPRDGITVTVCGIGAVRARRAAEAALERGARAVLSWGLAGGLAPDLSSGTVFLPRGVRNGEGQCWPTQTPGGAGMLLSVPAPVLRCEDKQALWRTTGCKAVDMESAAIAAVCAARGVPFVGVRAVADPADAPLPPWLPGLLDDHGRLRLARLGGRLLRQRDACTLLLQTARQYRAALKALRRASARLPMLVEAAA